MASTKSSPSMAQSTLSAFQQELFTIMNNLQTQANNEASTEATAFNSFLKEEEALVAKSTDFGGPSPNFTYPTWDGSKTPNGSKSYHDIFKKIIVHTLSQKTASQDEHEIMMAELQTSLLNVFKQTFLDGPLNGVADAPNQQSLITWAQDSIISANTFLDVSGQEGLINQLTKTIFEAQADKLPSGKTFDKKESTSIGYQKWITAQLSKYYTAEQKKNTSGVNAVKVTKSLLKQLKTTLHKYKLSSEDSIRQWVQTTITTLPPAIKVTNVQKDELVGALEVQIGKLFPQPDASFFYTNLQEILTQNIFNPPKAALASPAITPPTQLKVTLAATNASATGKKDGQLEAVVTGGKAPYIFAWEKAGEAEDLTPIKATPNIQKNLGAGDYTVIVIDSNGAKVNKTFKLTDTGLSLKLSGTVTEVKAYGGNDGKAAVIAAGGSSTYSSFTWHSVGDDTNLTGTPDAQNTNINSLDKMKAGTYDVTVTDSAGSTAMLQIVITAPKFDQNSGIKHVIEQILGSYGSGFINQSLIHSLEAAIEKVIAVAISYTFNNLAEYGAQGQLMSTTYDYQIISRVSDYTTALIKALEKDYEVHIPENSSNALTAAQNITASAVAFRNFAISLEDVSGAFESENNHTSNGNAKAGINYTQIKNLITNNSNPHVKTLIDLGKTAYLSNQASNVPLVKTAELNSVKLASSTAGLNTSLNKLLTSEQAAAIESLKNMKESARANYDAVYQNYNKQATAFFGQLDKYIEANQAFNLDMFQLESIQNALNSVNAAMMAGVKHGGYTKIN